MKKIVTLNQINAYLRVRQGFDLHQRRTNYATVDEFFGIYGTAPTCYLSLLARTPDFCFENLDEELYKRRRLVRMRCMRVSLFLLPKQLLPAAFQATKNTCQSAFRNIVEKSGVSGIEYTRTAEHICQLLESQYMTVSELKKALSPNGESIQRAFSFIVALMCAEGRLVRARVRGSWKSDLCDYTLFKNWLPEVDLQSIDPDQARAVLASHYFDAFGPATAEDFQWWSGFTKSETDQALNSLKNDLISIEVHGLAGNYFILKKNLEWLRGCSGEIAQEVSLLPVWDSYLMAYKDRMRYLPQHLNEHIYDKGGNATSAVLLHGCIGGVWDMEEKKKRLIIKVALFNKADKNTWCELKRVGTRLTEAIGLGDVCLLHCPPSPPVAQGSQNRFRSPLKGIKGEEVFL